MHVWVCQDRKKYDSIDEYVEDRRASAALNTRIGFRVSYKFCGDGWITSSYHVFLIDYLSNLLDLTRTCILFSPMISWSCQVSEIRKKATRRPAQVPERTNSVGTSWSPQPRTRVWSTISQSYARGRARLPWTRWFTSPCRLLSPCHLFLAKRRTALLHRLRPPYDLLSHRLSRIR
jgi:hypothetical protein